MEAGIIAAIILSIPIAVHMHMMVGPTEPPILAGIVFLCILGIISIQLKNFKFFKFQPTIRGTITAAYLGYQKVFVELIMINVYSWLSRHKRMWSIYSAVHRCSVPIPSSRDVLDRCCYFFTIPILLRVYFKYDRRLLGKLCRSPS